MLVKYR